MALGKVSRGCACVDERGKLLGAACPKRNRTGHGQWYYRIELPPRGRRHTPSRRRSGFASKNAAQDELDYLRELLAIPEERDTDALRRVGDLIAEAITAKQPLPATDTVRQLLRAATPTLTHPSVGQWVEQWLARRKKKLARNTYRSYESHVRLYLTRYLPHPLPRGRATGQTA